MTGYSNRIKDKVVSLDSEVRKVRHAENTAEEKANEAEKRASQAEDAWKKVEEVRKKAEDNLAAAQSENSRFLQKTLPAALNQARRQAFEEYQNSSEFDARLLMKYKEGMRDMKAGFTVSNPTVTGVDWSFVPEISRETTTEEEEAPQVEVEEGEVTGGARATEDVVILNESETRDDSASHLDQATLHDQ